MENLQRLELDSAAKSFFQWVLLCFVLVCFCFSFMIVQQLKKLSFIVQHLFQAGMFSSWSWSVQKFALKTPVKLLKIVKKQFFFLRVTIQN